MNRDASKPGWLLRNLPAVYREDPDGKKFLERFLAVFETRLDESERLIKKMPRYFDPESELGQLEELDKQDELNKLHLSWLGRWLSLDYYEYIGIGPSRKLMLNAVKLYKQKGTSLGLKNMAEILTGHECYVKEYMNNVFRTYGMDQCLEPRDKDCSKFPRTVSLTVDCSNKELLNRMGKYDDLVHYAWDSSSEISHSTHSVALFVKGADNTQSQITEQQIKSMLEPFIPAFLNLRVVFLKENA